MKIGLTADLMMIQNYTIVAEANGFVRGKSNTAPSPYAVWQVDNDYNGACNGHYFVDRDEAEWDFCARAFEWFEDNMYIHMVENNDEETSETHGVFVDTRTIENPPLERELLGVLKEIRTHMAAAAQLVDEMCAEMDRLTAEREANKCHQR